MISHNIDGTNSNANQLFDLLTVVANPQAYQERLTALEDAQEKAQKLIDLVGPADEIMAMLEQTRLDAIKSKQAIADAQTKADKIIADAKDQANEIAAKAQANYDAMKVNADNLMADAQAQVALAQATIDDAKKRQSQAVNDSKEAQKQIAEYQKLAKDAAQAKTDADDLKADLLAKHQAFIKSL